MTDKRKTIAQTQAKRDYIAARQVYDTAMRLLGGCQAISTTPYGNCHDAYFDWRAWCPICRQLTETYDRKHHARLLYEELATLSLD